MNSLRIATWNINNVPLDGIRAKVCQNKIDEIQADVWVLTETRAGFHPGKGFHLAAESGTAADLKPNRRWTSIWVREPLRGAPVPTSDLERTACARVEVRSGFVLNVYGTVLPWRGSTWRAFPNAEGRAFSEALAVQKADWSKLIQDDPDAWLCVAGDFNQDLLETGHYYSSKVERLALIEALKQVNLKCLTGGKTDPVARMDPAKANIDHICIGGRAQQIPKPAEVTAWSPEQEGFVISDHFGVVVEIKLF